jgi:hypothetical protein
MRRAALIAVSLLGIGQVDASLAAPRSDPGAGRGSGALDPALTALDACVARLDAEVDVGYQRIAMRCPGLRPALAAGGLERWLPPNWRTPDNDLSAGGLEELRHLLAGELTLRPVGRTPGVQRLRQVLAELGAPERPRSGKWGELESWLRKVAGRREPSGGSSGLARLFRWTALTARAERLIAYTGLGALVALATLILFNELRTAGALRMPSRGAGERMGARAADTNAESLRLEGADLADRPRMLLGAILDRVSRTRGLTGLRSLTARELIRAVDLGDVEAARQLAQLALTTERVRYAPSPASPVEIVAAVESARALLARLTGDRILLNDAGIR